jgi:hypothetical protein
MSRLLEDFSPRLNLTSHGRLDKQPFFYTVLTRDSCLCCDIPSKQFHYVFAECSMWPKVHVCGITSLAQLV